MRKLILYLFVISMWSLIFAEQQQTATMDSTLVSSLRSAVTNGSPNYDEVMTFYHDKLIDPNRDVEDDDWRENRESYEHINKF